MDEIIHQSMRLKIMAALASTPDVALEFKRLKADTDATDGNLSVQLHTLAQAGYVKILKDYANNRPRTRAKLTSLGTRALKDHVAYLSELLPSLGPAK